MNKQEVIKKLQSSLYPETSISSWDEGYNTGITQATDTVTELDKLDKEVVPQFVADWYEDNQDDFEINLFCGIICAIIIVGLAMKNIICGLIQILLC